MSGNLPVAGGTPLTSSPGSDASGTRDVRRVVHLPGRDLHDEQVLALRKPGSQLLGCDDGWM